MNAPGGMNSAYFFCREQPIQVNFVQAGGKPFLAQMGGLAQREVQEQEKTLQDRALRIAFGGYFFAPTGYGAASRAYLHALHSASIAMSVVNLSTMERRFVPDPLALSLLDLEIDPQFHLCHTEPSGIATMEDPPPRMIVMTTWEADTLPSAYVEALNRAIEVWVPCSYNVENFRKQLSVPVTQIPHPVPVRCFAASDRAELNEGLHLQESDFVFLSVATWQERKNLPGVIEAFLRAYPDEPNVILVLKTRFSFVPQFTALAQISAAINRAGGPERCQVEKRIRICSEIWPEEKLTTLSQRANCYVSLHSGEGWCYPLFDAATSGIPVIATGYSGPMDYLDARYHHLVDYELTAPREENKIGLFSFSPEMLWAAPNIEHAAALMRSVYENREQAEQQAREGARQLKIKYSLRAVGQMARQRLTELAEGLEG